MRRPNVSNVIAAIVLTAIMVTTTIVITGSTASAQCSCSASSTDGRHSCNVTCPAPGTCNCVSGADWAMCICGTGAGGSPLSWPLVPFTTSELLCAQELSAYIRSIGTPQAIALADAFDNCISANQSGNQGQYSTAENNFVQVNATTSAEITGLIASWHAAHPECSH
ncbi:MAG: hypothetical protein JST22_21200 [Bacteroidetes bacterium]|nr:hypothetical protein [Bacteroidota bacterium]